MNLIYANKCRFGGWCTFTAHLTHGMILADLDPQLIKISKSGKDEKKPRNFGYGLDYLNSSKDTLLSGIEDGNPTLILAADKEFMVEALELYKAGAWWVIHDPNEFKNDDVAKAVGQGERVITIRESVQKLLPKSTFIRHPYLPTYSKKAESYLFKAREKNAVAISRLDFDKHTDIILQAVDLGADITVRGAETRIYSFNKLVPKFKNYTQDDDLKRIGETNLKKFDRTMNAAQEICVEYQFMVDMSAIKRDGGGTQYTFLEAIDAGAVCVLNRDWILPGGTMQPGENCIAVGSPEELVKAVSLPYPEGIARQARKLLKAHDAKTIAAEFYYTISI